jgi:phage host-nuclease inhibitor protein Gam
MNLKFLFFSALTGFALTCCLTTTSYAQRPTPIGERIKMGNAEQIGEQEQNLIFALELNTDQADKFMAINEKYREVMNKLSSSPDFNTAEKQEYYQALRDEQNKEMKSFMSKSQYNKYLKLVQPPKKAKARKNIDEENIDESPYNVKIGERVKIGNAEQIGEFEQDIIFALELNTDQAEKFMAINEKYREVMNKLKSSPDFNTAEKKEYYQALIDERNKEMKPFMSGKQYKQYLALTAEL